MPAAMRGGSRVPAKPRAKAPPSSRKKTSPAKAQGGKAAGGYAPGKLGAAGKVGLAPHHALLAASGLLILALTATLATGGRAEKLSQAASGAVGSKFATLGFKLRVVRVKGASDLATADILKAAGLYKDEPLLGLDLSALRKRVEGVGWVKEAQVVRLLPDTLELRVVERHQLAVWQHGGRSYVIDDHGQVIPEADPNRFPRLPLIVGDGANAFAAKILPEVAQRPRLAERLEAFIRVDDRRWDLRLKDGSLVQLPAVGEEAALIQLEQLDQKSRLLELGFERIDLRDPTVAVVRPRDGVLPGHLVADGV